MYAGIHKASRPPEIEVRGSKKVVSKKFTSVDKEGGSRRGGVKKTKKKRSHGLRMPPLMYLNSIIFLSS